MSFHALSGWLVGCSVVTAFRSSSGTGRQEIDGGASSQMACT